MTHARKIIPLAAIAVAGAMALSGCGTTMTERTATGALGGAVAGQVIGGDTKSTVIGGVAGAALGAATTPR